MMVEMCWIYLIDHNNLMNFIEQVQYKAALIVSGCRQGTSRGHVKLYHERGWKSLAERQWSLRMTMFYQIKNGLVPTCLIMYLNIVRRISTFATETQELLFQELNV